jgi:hypothetical protein
VAWGTMYRGGVGWNEIIDDECYGRLFIFRVRDGALRFALGILRYIIPSLAKFTSPLPQTILLSHCSQNNTIRVPGNAPRPRLRRSHTLHAPHENLTAA